MIRTFRTSLDVISNPPGNTQLLDVINHHLRAMISQFFFTR